MGLCFSSQFPIYEFILFPSVFVPCASLLLHADADGYTVIERGAKFIAHPRLRTAASILAFVAFCNLLGGCGFYWFELRKPAPTAEVPPGSPG